MVRSYAYFSITRTCERLVFHHHEKDDQKNVFEHVLEVQTLRALVLHTLILSSGPMAEKSVHRLFN
jgi:hypothetical protein